MKIYLFPVWTPNYYTKVKNEKEKLEKKNKRREYDRKRNNKTYRKTTKD